MTDRRVARGRLAAVALIHLAALVPGVAAEEPLVLTPTTAEVGGTVTGRQAVSVPCTVYRLRWDKATGALLGKDTDVTDGAVVTFRVPTATGGRHLVVATCESAGSDDETVVGSAALTVTAPVVTTVPGTSTSGRPTTTLGTTTVRPTTTSTSKTTTTVPDVTTPTSVPRTTTSVPQPTTTTTSPAPPRNLEECERRAQEAQAAALAYQPERRMVVTQTYDVTAALGLDDSDVTAQSFPDGGSTTIVTIVGTRCTMEAQLLGPDFTIDPAGPRPQSFVGTVKLVWRWQVVPRRTGDQLTLILRLQPRVIEPNGEDRLGAEQTVDALITVEARPESLAGRTGDWISAFFGNELVRYALLPGGGAGFVSLYLWNRLRKPGTGRGALSRRRRDPDRRPGGRGNRSRGRRAGRPS